MNDEFLIECMENEIENSYFDFKKDIYDFDSIENKAAFLVDVLSFANSHMPGDKYIITGIKLFRDNSRDFIGITESKIQDGADYQSLINDNIEPNIVIDFKIVEYKGNKYGVFKIKKENIDQPYLFSKKYHKLDKGFIKIRKGQKNEFISRRDFDLFYKEKNNGEYSNIHVKGISNNKVNDMFEIKKFIFELNIEEIKEAIHSMFDEIMKIKLEKSSASFKLGNKLSVDEHYVGIIRQYSKQNNINLLDDFFDIGNITYYSMGFTGSTYYGSESERQKYQLISKLGQAISKFNALNEFYVKINKIYYTELAIYNSGKKYDEDIEVTLKIEKGKLLNYTNFPIPSESIIEDILNKNYLDDYLQNTKINGVNDYIGKIPHIFPIYPTSLKSSLGYAHPDYKEFVNYYNDYIQAIADYEVNSDNEYYYIKYNQKEIKPNETIYFPSRILFMEEPSIIEYEIKTKHNPNVINGKIVLKED